MLALDGLSVALDADAGLLRAIDGLSFSLQRGHTFALVGESGCGKSMTALALMRLLPDNGRITAGGCRLDGTDVLALPEWRMRGLRGGRIGMVFQEPASSLNPVMTVGAQVVEAIEAHTPLRGAAARAKAVDWLRRVGLPEPQARFHDHPFRLSGGQKQRVMIAIALAAEPDFLIADEPTTALDVTIQKQILELLQDLQRERRLGLLLITHDLAVVAGMAHEVALMYAGQIVELAPAAAFFAAPRHPYARLLLQAVPGAAKRGLSLAAIPGSVPALTQAFVACRFAPRCDRATALCHAKAPPLAEAAPAHAVRCLLYSEPAGMAAAAPQPARVREPAVVGAVATRGGVLLSVRHLTVRFPGRRGLLQRARPPRVAVDDVSFDIAAGQTLALVGESGCGKTSTGKAVMQLLRRVAVTEGQALLDGCDLLALDGRALRAARRDIQMIFQDPFGSLNPRLRVQQILEEGVIALRPEWDAAERRLRLQALAEQVGLGRDALLRYPHEFSGGQRQRIAIARALAVEPKLIVCDEPTSALDVSVQAQILNLLRQLQRELGVSYLFITHNMGVVEYVADRVAVMRAGRIEEQGTCGQVLGSPGADYTKTLLAAVPRLAAQQRQAGE